MNYRLREAIRLGTPLEALHSASVLHGGKGGAPPPPDYTGAAAAQAQSSKEVTNMQLHANRPDQYTPWGSSTWSSAAGTDPATGQPITNWQQQIQLSPQQQQALNSQMAIQQGRSNLAQGFMGRVGEAYAQPFSTQGMTPMSGVPQAQMTGTYDPRMGTGQTTRTTNEPAFGAQRERIEQGLFDRMAPQHQRAEDSARTMLANQGLTPGSDAYNTELERLHQQQAGERYNAMAMGGQEQANMQQMLLGQQQQAYGQQYQQGQMYNQAQQQAFNQALGANQQNFQQTQAMANYQNQLRQQQIAEQAMMRGMSLNEMNALLSGQQVSTPNMPNFQSAQAAQPLQSLSAAQMQGQYGLDAAKMEAESSSQLWGGIAKMAGTAAMFMSDVRLKSNIVRVGTHPLGIGIYDYDMFGRRERGIMAHEVLEVAPHLVKRNSLGYLMVDYGGL